MAGLNGVIWSKESYTPRTLLATYGNKLPVIIQIVSGYCGVGEEQTVATSEVVRIHSWVNQKRVLARDMRGRLLSIPEDYVIKFEVLSQKKKRHHRAKKLKDVIKKYHLPVTVRFDTKTRWKLRVGGEVYESNNFGQMHLVKSYMDTYLRTNPIHNGIISTRVLLFPASLEATMKVAEGSRDVSPSEWMAQLDAYKRALRGVRFDKVRGVIDITVFSNSTDEDVTDGTSTLQLVTPRVANGVKASVSTPSEIAAEKTTQTSVPSSGGTTDANSSITASVVTEMSSPGRCDDVSRQHVARIQVVDDPALSPTFISGPVAQMDELHIRPVTVQCNGNLPNGENVVISGRPRTYSDGAAGERMWKAKMQRSRSSTLHTYSGTVPSPQEGQHVVYGEYDVRNDPVVMRRGGQPANTDRQLYRSVENVRYEPPPQTGFLLQPAARNTMHRQPIGDSVPIIARDGGNRIGCGRVTSSYSGHARQYPSSQEVYSDSKLHIGIVNDPPTYRDAYRYSGNYEPGGSVRSDRVYVRQNPGPRPQQRMQHLRRITTMPTGGHRFSNRYTEYNTSGSRDFDQGYNEQRIISRSPRDFDEFDGDDRGSNLGQVTIHGPGLMTTGRYRLGSPQSYGSGRTWMYSEDDRNDVFGRDDQGYREVSRRSTFCGGSTNASRRTADSADSWVSVVDVSDKARRRNGGADSGYDDMPASSFEYVAGSVDRCYSNGRHHVSSPPSHHQSGQRQDVLYEEDRAGTRESCTREVQTEMRAELDDQRSQSRDVIGNQHGGNILLGTDNTRRTNGVEALDYHGDVLRSEMNHYDMADAQTETSTLKGDASMRSSTGTVCADDTTTTPHAVLVRKYSDQNNNDEYVSTSDTAASSPGEATSCGVNRRASINSLRDVYSSDKSKTATAELSVFTTSESFSEALNGGALSAAPARANKNNAALERATTTDDLSAVATTTESTATETSTDVVRRRQQGAGRTTSPEGGTHDDGVGHLETSARDSIIDLDKFLQAQMELDGDTHSHVSVDHQADRKLGVTTVVEGNPWYEVTN